MPERVAEYRLAPEAKRDLEAIWLYTLEEWGLTQANRYTDEAEKGTVTSSLRCQDILYTSG